MLAALLLLLLLNGPLTAQGKAPTKPPTVGATTRAPTAKAGCSSSSFQGRWLFTGEYGSATVRVGARSKKVTFQSMTGYLDFQPNGVLAGLFQRNRVALGRARLTDTSPLASTGTWTFDADKCTVQAQLNIFEPFATAPLAFISGRVSMNVYIGVDEFTLISSPPETSSVILYATKAGPAPCTGNLLVGQEFVKTSRLRLGKNKYAAEMRSRVRFEEQGKTTEKYVFAFADKTPPLSLSVQGTYAVSQDCFLSTQVTVPNMFDESLVGGVISADNSITFAPYEDGSGIGFSGRLALGPCKAADFVGTWDAGVQGFFKKSLGKKKTTSVWMESYGSLTLHNDFKVSGVMKRTLEQGKSETEDEVTISADSSTWEFDAAACEAKVTANVCLDASATCTSAMLLSYRKTYVEGIITEPEAVAWIELSVQDVE